MGAEASTERAQRKSSSVSDYAYCLASYSTANIFELHGPKAEAIGTVKTEAVAERIVTLLNRHGMEDCDAESMAAALLDLEARYPQTDG